MLQPASCPPHPPDAHHDEQAEAGTTEAAGTPSRANGDERIVRIAPGADLSHRRIGYASLFEGVRPVCSTLVDAAVRVCAGKHDAKLSLDDHFRSAFVLSFLIHAVQFVPVPVPPTDWAALAHSPDPT